MAVKSPTRRPAPPPAAEYIEVVDDRDRPLAVMDMVQAHRQGLRHRAVLVLVYNAAGKVYLQQRSPTKALYPGRWDVSASGHVQAFESRHDAAARELFEELGLTPARLHLKREVPACMETGYEFVSLFSAGSVHEAPRPNPEEVTGGMFVDQTELARLMEGYRELLTPGLVYFWEQGLIFSADRG